MPSVRANGVEIHYKAMGDGPALLLIPGFACDLAVWAVVARKLAAYFRVMLLDHRGTGGSASFDGAYGMAEMMGDAVAVLDALGAPKAHVAGHSMGGQIAQLLALDHPDRVASLTLMASCARPPALNQAVIRSWGELPRQVDAATAARLTLPWIYTNEFYARPGMIDNVIELMVANPRPPTAHAVLQQSHAICTFDSSARLGCIRCPTLVVTGRADLLFPLECSEELANGIPGATLKVLPNAGHGMLVEAPRLVASAMLSFLQKYR